MAEHASMSAIALIVLHPGHGCQITETLSASIGFYRPQAAGQNWAPATELASDGRNSVGPLACLMAMSVVLVRHMRMRVPKR